MRRARILDPSAIPLPPGTRVVLTERHEDAEGHVKAGSLGQVLKVSEDGQVEVATPAGRRFVVPREALVVQKRRVLARAAQRGEAWEAWRGRVIFASVVGSQAWGLADAGSDQDVRGAFVWPFADAAGLYEVPDEIQDPAGDAQYWEVGKLIQRALNADPNAFEALYSPLRVACTPLGEELLGHRRIFISEAIIGSYGRYALSQFKKIEKRLAGGEAGRIARPKNAYNLIRLLHAALRWIREGEPLIAVEEPLRGELLAIKAGEVAIEEVLRRGQALAAEVEAEHARCQSLPEQPDVAAAHSLLVRLRRAAAEGGARGFTEAPRLPAPLIAVELQERAAGGRPTAGRPAPEDVEAVLFDLDDTLFDCYRQCVLPAHREAAEAMRAAGCEGLAEDIAEWRLKLRALAPSGDLEVMVCAALGLPCSPAIAAAGRRAFFEREPGALEPFPGTRELLAALRAAGKRVAIITRGHEATQRRKVASLGLEAAVDGVFVVSGAEPKSKALEQAAAGLEAGRVLVVGDNARDELPAARGLGMRPCWLSRAGEFSQPPEQPCWTISSLRELSAWLGGGLTESE